MARGTVGAGVVVDGWRGSLLRPGACPTGRSIEEVAYWLDVLELALPRPLSHLGEASSPSPHPPQPPPLLTVLFQKTSPWKPPEGGAG